MFFLQLSLAYVWIIELGTEAEVCGCIGTLEDGDGEMHRDELLLQTLLNALRARSAGLWYIRPVGTIASRRRSSVLLVPRSWCELAKDLDTVW